MLVKHTEAMVLCEAWLPGFFGKIAAFGVERVASYVQFAKERFPENYQQTQLGGQIAGPRRALTVRTKPRIRDLRCSSPWWLCGASILPDSPSGESVSESISGRSMASSMI